MKQIENNIINSFRLAKTDIIRIQKSLLDISKKQKEIMEKLDSLKANQTKTATRVSALAEKVKNQKSKPVVKKVVKKAVKKAAKPAKKQIVIKKVIQKVATKKAKIFVSSQDGKKFHIPECPFAQNIKPKFKVTYKTKVKALNEGYKPCNCVK